MIESILEERDNNGALARVFKKGGKNESEVKRVWLDDYAVWIGLKDGRRVKEDFVDYSRLAS